MPRPRSSCLVCFATILTFAPLLGQQGSPRPKSQATVAAPPAKPTPSAPKPSYDSLITSIVDLIQAGKLNDAAPEALEATRLAPDRYEGHLYLGIVRFRQGAVADAEISLKRALSLAPEDKKKKVQDLIEVVVDTEHFQTLMTTAQEAEKEGAKAKAALNYASAWGLFPERADVAAKALKGYLATDNDFQAARIWNLLTKAQKSDRADLFAGVKIDPAAVNKEIAIRKPPLEEAIRTGNLDEAIQRAIPIGEADPDQYRSVVAALMFLKGDRKLAYNWSTGFKPEQLIRMDFFSADQMTQMINSPVFQAYLQDVVGGNREERMAALRKGIEYPQALAKAKSLPDTSVRLAALQTLSQSYSDHSFEIAQEIRSTAKLEATRLYRAIADLLTSVGAGHLDHGGSIQYKVKEVEPCSWIQFESTATLPSNYSRGSHFIWGDEVTIYSDHREEKPQMYFSVVTGNPQSMEGEGNNPTLSVSGSGGTSVNVYDVEQNVQLFKKEDIGWTQRQHIQYYRFFFDPATPDLPAKLLRLFEAARDVCKLTD